MAEKENTEYLQSREAKKSIKPLLNGRPAIWLRQLKHSVTTASGVKKIIVKIAMYMLLLGLAFVFL